MRIRKYIQHEKSDGPPTKKPLGHYIAVAVIMIMFTVTFLSMQGCAASKSREHRAVLQHQTEGRLIYREADGVQYFVECRNGLKYVGSSISKELIGPMDVCTGEKSE